jgi:hypothetical protein
VHIRVSTVATPRLLRVHKNLFMSHLDVARAEVPSASLITSRLSHALHTSHARSCTHTTIFFLAYHICSLGLIILKDVLFIV